ncbi:MAG: PepSY-associated TM helix domain-containing protein [Alphaproteobacteria bacterium]
MSETKSANRAFDKGAFYRLTRMLHGYLSAFAFIALMFFSVTGVLLNHPEWFENYTPREAAKTVTLAKADIDTAARQKDPGRALAALVASKTDLPGAFSSEDIDGGQAILRLDGPKGTSDVIVDMETGKAEVRTTKASFNSLMMDLHRGKNSGGPWRLVIDATAYVVLALSILGYILFFSLRFRLKTSLILTGVSLALLAAVMIWLVP